MTEDDGGATTPRSASAAHRLLEAQFRARFVQSALPQAMVDMTGALTAVNDAFCGLLGRDRPGLVGTPVVDLVDRRAGGRADALARLLAGEQDEAQVERVLTGRDGTSVPVCVDMTVLRDECGTAFGAAAFVHDLSALRASDEALRESEARFRAVADAAEEGIWAVAWTGQTLYANQRMAAILGLPLTRMYEVPAVVLLDGGSADDLLRRLADRGAAGIERYETPYGHPDGGRRHLGVAASPLPGPGGELVGSLAIVSDITQVRHTEDELRRSGLHDALTGLPNRALLADRLERALARGIGATAVLFVGLDRFQLLNDAGGHAVGDEVLGSVGRRLQGAVRVQDTVARFGGDEFVILAEDIDEEHARALGEALLAVVAAPRSEGAPDLHLTASLGIDLSPGTSEELLRHAHSAMYAAKAAGRGRIHMFDRSTTDDAPQRFTLSNDLRTALRDDALEMHFQPILDLQTGVVVGVEALARWTHPVIGPVSPERFVALAESTGLAAQLDTWAMRAALLGARQLRSAGAIAPTARVSVNLSAGNLASGALEGDILAETAAAELRPADVVLEITERAVMADPAGTIALLRRLRDHGYGVAIDDFGTGQSSLAYLRDLPVTNLKIDHSFVAEMQADSDATAIVASIVDLARAVGITVTAEGVETAEQASLLRGMGCHSAQGWLWSPAMSAEDAGLAGRWSSGFDTGPAQALAQPGRRDRLKVERKHGLDRMLSLYRSGASLSTIAAALNVDGYITPKGLRWHSTSVARAVADVTHPSAAAAVRA